MVRVDFIEVMGSMMGLLVYAVLVEGMGKEMLFGYIVAPRNESTAFG